MNDSEPAVHRPFGRFRVTTERMPDGRTIRYYEWPDDRPADAHVPPAPRATGEPDEAGASGVDGARS